MTDGITEATESAGKPLTAATVTFTNGMEADVSTRDVIDYVKSYNGAGTGYDLLEVTPIVAGFARLDVNLNAIDSAEEFDFSGELVPILVSDGIDRLRHDVPYFVMFEYDEDGNPLREAIEAPLWTCDLDALQAERPEEWEVMQVSLQLADETLTAADNPVIVIEHEDGTEERRGLSEFGLDPENLFAFYSQEANREVTLGDLLGGLTVMHASIAVAHRMIEQRKKEQGGTLPPLTAIRPINHLVPVAKDSHYLTDPDAFSGLKLDVGKRRGQTFITFALTAPEGTMRAIDGEPLQLDYTDRMIISAVASLKEAARNQTGQPVVSAYEILEEMGFSHPKPERCAEVDQRIKTLMAVGVEIDCTEELNRRGISGKYVIRGHLIEATAAEYTDQDGKATVRYRLTDDPPTYKHAKEINQVVVHPSRLLHLTPIKADGTEVRKASTDRQLVIRNYLLERIYSLMNRKSQISDTILYATLCEKAGVRKGNRDAKKAVADSAENYLRALKKEGVIQDFQVKRTGRQHAKESVTVIVKRP